MNYVLGHDGLRTVVRFCETAQKKNTRTNITKHQSYPHGTFCVVTCPSEISPFL
jgi:hypothetical protein